MKNISVYTTSEIISVCTYYIHNLEYFCVQFNDAAVPRLTVHGPASVLVRCISTSQLHCRLDK